MFLIIFRSFALIWNCFNILKNMSLFILSNALVKSMKPQHAPLNDSKEDDRTACKRKIASVVLYPSNIKNIIRDFAMRIARGVRGHAPRRKFFKRCNLVRFKVYFDRILSLFFFKNYHFLYIKKIF